MCGGGRGRSAGSCADPAADPAQYFRRPVMGVGRGSGRPRKARGGRALSAAAVRGWLWGRTDRARAGQRAESHTYTPCLPPSSNR